MMLRRFLISREQLEVVARLRLQARVMAVASGDCATMARCAKSMATEAAYYLAVDGLR
jgi:hypothetical protein